ncbi:hypothetical protein KFL_003800090 [Klebsormidium nitens]|uniref:Uncharacterized protein n=1 Tax=Klebsormidium nitens TaxID=105231 RepID=A0A1Y1IB97_KLENI|nr:hypothetical protein KFL_003800090 [Klebsormidium nitens]|eukprot:GAQ87833.1 hypothetical protein KFL_003800090 [Klebsormidium nitens]
MAAASEDVSAVSFEHVQGLVPLTERSAAELLAGSAVQTGLSRHVFGSIAVIMETFKIFESEQELRRHPDVQGEWLLRIAELMHVIRHQLFEVKFALGQNERKLRPLAEELDRFNRDCLTRARNILSPASYESLFQSRHTFPSPEEQSQRNLQLREKVALLVSEGDSASGSGSRQGSSETEIRKLRKRVKELEEQLRVSEERRTAELRESEESRRSVSEENVELQRRIQQLQAAVNSFEYKSSNMESVVLDLEARNRKLAEEARESRRGGRRSRAKKTAEEPSADQPLSQPGSAASTPGHSATRASFELPGEANRAEESFSTDFTRRGSAREPYDVRNLQIEGNRGSRRSGAPEADTRGDGDVSKNREAAPEPRATNRPPSFDQSYKKTARNQKSPAAGSVALGPVGTPFGTPAGGSQMRTPLDAVPNGSDRYPPKLELEPESEEPVHFGGHEPRNEADTWHDDNPQGVHERSPPKAASWQRGLIQSIVKRTLPKEQVMQAPRDDRVPVVSDGRGRGREAAETAFPNPSEPGPRKPRERREPDSVSRSRAEPPRSVFLSRDDETSVLPAASESGVSRPRRGAAPEEITFSSFIYGVSGGWEDQILESRLEDAVSAAVSGFDAFPSTTFSRFRGRANVNRLKGNPRPTFAFCDFASNLAKECFDDGTSRGRLVLKLEGWTLPVQKPRTQDMESVSYWERRALDDLWARARGATPAKTLYARFLGEGASATAVFEELLRTVVRTNAEGDRAEGIEEVLVAGKHAYVFLKSESVGDELFRRLSGGDANLEQKLFISRRKDYVPAPGVLSEEQIVEDRTAEKASGFEQRTGGGGDEGTASGGLGRDQPGTETTSNQYEKLAAPSESGVPKLSESRRRRQVWVGDLPNLSEPELSNRIQSAVEEAMSGFDVLPPASLEVHGATTMVSRAFGFVEMSTILGADLFVDAVNRGQIQALSGENDVLKVPRHQKWTMEVVAPPSEEQREQVELWREAETLNPAAATYVRFTREFVPRKREQAVREEVERLAGTDGGSGIEKVLCASKHAYVAFRSEGAADEFFRRAHARGLEARLCFVRHRAYLPGPGMFVGFYAPDTFMFYRKPATVASFMAAPSRGLGGTPETADKGTATADEQGFEDVPSKFEASPPKIATSGQELHDTPTTAPRRMHPEVEEAVVPGGRKPLPTASAELHIPEEAPSPHGRNWEQKQREIFVKDIPDSTPADTVRANLTESFNEFFSGYDALPPGLLDVRGVRGGLDSRTGARIAYVEVASVLASQLVSDAQERGPGRVAFQLRTLRDENGTKRKIFTSSRQKWMLEFAEPTAAEGDALHAAWGAVGNWDPRKSAYARVRDAEPDLGGRVRGAIQSYARKEWDLEVVSIGRHAFVRFPDVAAADEFFDRPQEKHDAQNAEPVKPQASEPQELEVQEPKLTEQKRAATRAVSEALPIRLTGAKPPAAKPLNPPHREATGAADAADVWSHDMYEAVYADGGDQDGQKRARAREKGEQTSEGAGKEESLYEGDEMVKKEGWGLYPGKEEKRAREESVEAAWPESRSSEVATGWDGVSKGADDVSGRAAGKDRKKEATGAVGWKKPVDRWTNPFAQLVGFEEEIVPPSSIHEETVRVRGGKTQKDGSDSANGKGRRCERNTVTSVDEAERNDEIGGEKHGGEEGESFGVASKSGSGKGGEEEVESADDLKWITETGWESVEHPGNSTEKSGPAPFAKAAESGELYGEELGDEDDAELFEDVPAGFEAEPERTGTPEWSEEPGEEVTVDANSLIGVGSFFGVTGSQDSQAVRTEVAVSPKGAAQPVAPTGQISSGLGAARGSGDDKGLRQKGNDPPSEFELSLKYVDRAVTSKQEQLSTEDLQDATRDEPAGGEAKPEAGTEKEAERNKKIDFEAVRDEEESLGADETKEKLESSEGLGSLS